MKTQRFHHVIDFLFAAALFGVFLVSSVMVIAVGAGAYRNITEKSQEDYTLRTSLSYVNEKLRQADSNGALSVGMVGGNTALNPTRPIFMNLTALCVNCSQNPMRRRTRITARRCSPFRISGSNVWQMPSTASRSLRKTA